MSMYKHANSICRSYSGNFAGEYNDKSSTVWGSGLGVKTCQCPARKLSIDTRTMDPDGCLNFTRPCSMAINMPVS